MREGGNALEPVGQPVVVQVYYASQIATVQHV